VAKDCRIGKATRGVAKSVIPVAYSRVGLFCADFELQAKPKAETIYYVLVRKGGGVEGRRSDSRLPLHFGASARRISDEENFRSE